MHLNYACDIEDISVTIGQGVCNVTYLATNRLSCAPPTTQPEPDATGHGAGRTPRVTVSETSWSPFSGIPLFIQVNVGSLYVTCC